jgi:flavin reductase (DIM6/NTAB) family NADH-FMN oxidoreductase RutF
MNPELKKAILRKMTYGMWVLASGTEGDLEASSVTWVTQVGFTPPLISVAIKRDSRLAEVVKRHRAFTLHLLSAEQQAVAGAFIKPTVVEDGKIGGHAHKAAPVTGMPLLDGFPAWLEARIVETIEPGDHAVFVAEVVAVDASNIDAKPFTLAQAGWSYGG